MSGINVADWLKFHTRRRLLIDATRASLFSFFFFYFIFYFFGSGTQDKKAQIFNDYFIQQCTTIDTGSKLPQHIPATITLLNDFVISEEKILNIIRSLNFNKAHGWDGISVRMIKLSDSALVIPLKIIFEDCLIRGIFPEIWKYANVVPVHKRNEKNLKGNYRPISLLPVFGKMLEQLIYDSLYSHLA